MTFTPKDWQNLPSTSTPLNATAMVDLETRLSDYAKTFEIILPPTWSSAQEPGSGGRFTSGIVSPFDVNKVLIAGDMLGIGYSDDAGATWEATYGMLSWEMNSFTWHPTEPQTVWCGSMSGPVKSVDGGKNWTTKRTGMPAMTGFPYSQPIERVEFDPTNSNHMTAFGGNWRQFKAGPAGASNYGKVYESNDGGENWSLKGTIVTDGNIVSVVHHPTTFSTIYAAVLGQGIWKSTNTGATWTQVGTTGTGLAHPVVLWLTITPDGGTIFAALRYGTVSPFAAGGIYKSTDAGASWVSANTGLPQVANTTATSATSMWMIHRASDGTLYTADQSFLNQKVYKSIDNAANWTALSTTVTGKFYPAGMSPFCITTAIQNPSVVYGGTSDTLIKSNDAGATWFDAGNKTAPNGNINGRGFSGLLGNRVAFSPAKKGLLITAGWDAGNILRTENSGASWTRPSATYDNYNGGYDVCFAGPTSDIVYAMLGQANTFQGLGVSLDAGKTFTWKTGGALPTKGSFGNRAFVGVCPGSADGSVAYASTTTGVVVKTTDTGQTWSAHWSTTPSYTVGHSKNFATIYIGTASGVYSGDGSGSYTLMSNSPKATRFVLGPDGTLYAVAWTGVSSGTFQGLWKLVGTTWTQLNGSGFIRDVAIDPYDANNLAFIQHCDPFRDNSLAAGVYRSMDAGATFEQINDGLPMLRGYSIDFDPFNPGVAVIGTAGRGYWKGNIFANRADAPLSVLSNYPTKTELNDAIAGVSSGGGTVTGGIYDGSLASGKFLASRDQQVRTLPYTFPSGTQPVRGQWWRISPTASPPVSDGKDGYIVSLSPVISAGATVAKGAGEIKVRVNGAGHPVVVTAQSSPYIVPGINSVTELSAPSVVYSYESNDSVVWANCWTRAGGYIRLRVDGEYVGLAPTSVGGGNAFVNFVCSFDADGAKTRRIEWEMWHGCFLSSIFASSNGSVSLARPFPGLSLYVVGDSFIDGSFGQYPGFEDMAHIAAARLGIEKVTIDALGGTGYLKTNGVASYPNYQTRLAANIAQCNPDVVLISGSINDGTGVTSPEVVLPPAANSIFDTIKTKAPNAKIFVITFANFRQPDGYFQNGVTTANIAIRDTATANALVTGYRDMSYLLTGWGYQTNETGVGTQDIMLSSDRAHPTPVGHEIFAREIAALIEAGLEGGILAVTDMPVSIVGTYFADTFKGTDGATLESRAATDGGGTWLINTTFAPSSNFVVDTNRVRRNSTANAYYYLNSVIPTDGYCEADIFAKSIIAGTNTSIFVRGSTTLDTGIHALYNQGSGSWRLYEAVSGTLTQIGTSYVPSPQPSGLFRLRLEVQGTTARLYIDGVLRITATLTTVTGAGKSGIRETGPTASTSSTGFHFENIVSAGL